MKVVLLERVENLGAIGDVVTVKDGFARNFLLPREKALRATSKNLEKFELDRAAIEARNERNKGESQKVADKIDGQSYVMIRQAGETGQLYGSVASRDVADALIADGFTVARSQIDLATPIKTVGVHSVALHLHAEVAVTISVNVARSADEANRQAAGEDLTAINYDDAAAEEFAAGQAEAGSAADFSDDE